MSSQGPAGSDWTDQEIDLIVADYFDMLRSELARAPYVKAERNRELQRLTGRSHGSIEFKHQNISAVLLKLGMPWIAGYKPMANYQNALLDGVERYLSVRGDNAFAAAPPAVLHTAAEDGAIFIEEAAPPLHVRDDDETPALRRLVRKFDPAARDERNRALGKQGEERVLLSERSRLRAAGRDDLARKIVWVSQEAAGRLLELRRRRPAPKFARQHRVRWAVGASQISTRPQGAGGSLCANTVCVTAPLHHRFRLRQGFGGNMSRWSPSLHSLREWGRKESATPPSPALLRE